MAAPIDFTKLFVRDYEKNDGIVLQFHQSGIGDVGCVVWDAALVLSKYLETKDFDYGVDLKAKVVVELGAGTGAVGLVAGSLGAEVTVTDLPEFVPLMDYNIKVNEACMPGKVKAAALTWGSEINLEIPSNPNLVLLADCIYYDESLEPLVKTIRCLCGESTEVLCCYEERDTGNKPELQRRFFELIREHFTVEKISTERQDEHFASDDIHIFKFRLKPRD